MRSGAAIAVGAVGGVGAAAGERLIEFEQWAEEHHF
jgi:hypothetical protein